MTVIESAKVLLRDRRIRRIVLAAPFVAVGLYWFALVGFSNPATRLKKDIERQMLEVRFTRLPLTFEHRPFNQWTFGIHDFDVHIGRHGTIDIRYGKAREKHYSAKLAKSGGSAGDFSVKHVGSRVEIELMPAGNEVEVSSVSAMDEAGADQ